MINIGYASRDKAMKKNETIACGKICSNFIMALSVDKIVVTKWYFSTGEDDPNTISCCSSTTGTQMLLKKWSSIGGGMKKLSGVWC